MSSSLERLSFSFIDSFQMFRHRAIQSYAAYHIAANRGFFVARNNEHFSATRNRSLSYTTGLTNNSNAPSHFIQSMGNDALALRFLLEDGPKYYAKVTLCGRQFQSVQVGDTITTHRIKGPLVGDILRLTQIMEIGSPSCTLRASGMGIPRTNSPFIDPAFFIVRARIQSHDFGKQVPAKRGRQRKGRRKKLFSRPHITTLKIVEISPRRPSSTQ